MKQLKIYDAISGQELAPLPEEIVRQKLVHYLIKEKGFPKSLLVVEQKISLLPHLLPFVNLPERRIDVLCYTKEITPLLLIECKAGKLTKKAFNQVLGYNDHIQAPFMGLANAQEFILGWYDKETGYRFIQHLPTYQELLAHV